MPGGPDRFYVHYYTKNVPWHIPHLARSLATIYILARVRIFGVLVPFYVTGDFLGIPCYIKQRQVLLLPLLSSDSTNVRCLHSRIFLSLAISAIIHRSPWNCFLCDSGCCFSRTVLAVSALVLCLVVGLRLAALHVVVHIIAVSCHFSVPPRVVFKPRTFSAAASSSMVRSRTIIQLPRKELFNFFIQWKNAGIRESIREDPR